MGKNERGVPVVLRLCLALLFTAAVVAAPRGGATADAATTMSPAQAEARFVALINGVRSSKGLATLSVDGQLTGQARAWTNRMAADNQLKHAGNLASGITTDWEVLGENVGTHGAVDVDRLFQAFVSSPGHYANLVEPRFDRVGVGVVITPDGVMWTTHRFMGVRGEPAPTTTAPPDTTPPTTAPPVSAPPPSAAPPAPAPAPDPAPLPTPGPSAGAAPAPAATPASSPAAPPADRITSADRAATTTTARPAPPTTTQRSPEAVASESDAAALAAPASAAESRRAPTLTPNPAAETAADARPRAVPGSGRPITAATGEPATAESSTAQPPAEAAGPTDDRFDGAPLSFWASMSALQTPGPDGDWVRELLLALRPLAD